MSSDPREGFWNSIDAEPTSDLPVLVFADWLEEHGSPEDAARLRKYVSCTEPKNPAWLRFDLGASKSKFLQNWCDFLASVEVKPRARK